MSSHAVRWHAANTFSHRAFPAARLAAEREQTVSICLPARDGECTIGPILEQLVPLRELGAIDQIVVVDRSTDGTARIARQFGVEVHDQEELAPELGPVLGKGDAMWRCTPCGETWCASWTPTASTSERTSRAGCSGPCCASEGSRS
ncbi:MAG: hypothetical protein M3071_18920 [Actinomycetota bacterium]|nr:hypothetical protein [Actinomycetota bacterium]